MSVYQSLVLALALASLLAQATPITDSDRPVCDCAKLDSCRLCVPVGITDPCLDQCQWCLPSLTCQQCTFNPDSKQYDCPNDAQCKSADPVLTSYIGAHQEFKCQASDSQAGLGPKIMDATLTTGGQKISVWNGTAAPGVVVPTAGGKDVTLELSGLNWGEKNISLGINQAIRICPFDGMTDWLTPSTGTDSGANPRGPDHATCFNCSSYDGSKMAIQVCGLSSKNSECSKLTCTDFPAGIGGVDSNLAVFIDIYGEPPSVVADHDAVVEPTINKDGPFTDMFARISYAGPEIKAAAISNGTNGRMIQCTIPADTHCEGAAGDRLQLSATNLPLNDQVIAAYQAASNKPAVTLTVGGLDCANLAFNSSTGTLDCEIPVSSGGAALDVTLTVGGQMSTVKGLFYYPKPILDSVHPNTLASFGGPLTITGVHFLAYEAGVSKVSLMAEGGDKLDCIIEPAHWSTVSINCTAPLSKDGAHSVVTKVIVHTGSGSSTGVGVVSYSPCDFFETVAGLCRADGAQVCNGNYNCTAGQTSFNKACDSKLAGCVCDAAFECMHGGVLDPTDCSCSCSNGYSLTTASAIPDTIPKGMTGTTCDVCNTNCGTLDKKVQNEAKCGCEFNKLHWIWIVAIILLVVAAIVYGVYRWRKASTASKGEPLLSPAVAADGADEQSEVTEM